MTPEKIEITQEMLELALLSCAKDDPAPAGAEPCEGCYLQQKHLVKDGHMSTGETCFMHPALDTITYIREINDFEHSQCAKLLAENGQLRTVIAQMDPQFFTRKCRICGCDWDHACNDHDYWVEDDLCSACAARGLK